MVDFSTSLGFPSLPALPPPHDEERRRIGKDRRGEAQAELISVDPPRTSDGSRPGRIDPLLVALHAGQRDVVWRAPTGELTSSLKDPPRGLLSGSFNPLHDGHKKLRDAAAKILGTVGYELTCKNADKPPIEPQELLSRGRQFADQPVAFSRASTFVQKARLFPGTTFVVGADTATRIIDPRFYDKDPAKMLAALDEIRAQGGKFLVAARSVDGELQTLDDIPIPASHADMFQAIPVEDFRLDISSTQIRAHATAIAAAQTAAAELSTTQKIGQLNAKKDVSGCFVGSVGSAAADLMLSVPGSSATLVYSLDTQDRCSKLAAEALAKRELASLNELATLSGLRKKPGVPSLSDRRRFALAGTASHHGSRGEAWLLLAYSLVPDEAPKTLVVHARLSDRDVEGQQDALGRVAVNLLHTAYLEGGLEGGTQRLLDNVSPKAVQIDQLFLDGTPLPLPLTGELKGEGPEAPPVDAPPPASTVERSKAQRICASGALGTVAEIGAGQTVANILRRQPNGQGTVAKRVCQYGMEASERAYDLPGHPARRAVSAERVGDILDAELTELRKAHARGRVFAFANSLAVKDDGRGGGWIGVDVSPGPGVASQRLFVHTRLDRPPQEQRGLLRALGLNVLELALRGKAPTTDDQVTALREGLPETGMELDAVLTGGDDRAINLALVRAGASDLALFGRDGGVLAYTEHFYKKQIHCVSPSEVEGTAPASGDSGVQTWVCLPATTTVESIAALNARGYDVLVAKDVSQSGLTQLLADSQARLKLVVV